MPGLSYMTMVAVLLTGVIFCIVIWSCFIVACSDEDREKDDEEQIEYLRKWKEEHGNADI